MANEQSWHVIRVMFLKVGMLAVFMEHLVVRGWY